MNLVTSVLCCLLLLMLQPWIYSTARNAVSEVYLSCVNCRFRVTKGMIFVIAFFMLAITKVAAISITGKTIFHQ